MNDIQSTDNVNALDESMHIANAMETDFAKQMNKVKTDVLDTAHQTDDDFKQQVVENVKQAAVKLTKVEKDKAEYQEQQVEYESQKLETKQQEEAHMQIENAWDNRRKKRQYHYDGVKPIMEFIGINEPMNLLFLYCFALLACGPFLLQKIWDITIGALFVGACNKDRSKTAKAFIWTILAIFVLFIVFVTIYLFLLWQEIDILKFLK